MLLSFEIVTIEKFLNRWSLKHELVLTLLLGTYVFFPRSEIVCLLLVEVVLIWLRFVWCVDLFIQQCLPIEISQPNMVFYFGRSIKPKSIAGFPLETFVDEICRLE